MHKEARRGGASSDKWRRLWHIFHVTFRVGLFTFGGGGALILMLQREFTDKRGWLDEETMTDVLAISRSLPGVIAVNTTIMVGYRIAGLWGAIIGGVACVLPSVLVLIAVTLFYSSFISNPHFAGALRGVRGVVIALLCATVLRLRGQSIRDLAGALIFCASLAVAVFFRQINVAFIVLAGVAAGLLLYYRPGKREHKNDRETKG